LIAHRRDGQRAGKTTGIVFDFTRRTLRDFSEWYSRGAGEFRSPVLKLGKMLHQLIAVVADLAARLLKSEAENDEFRPMHEEAGKDLEHSPELLCVSDRPSTLSSRRRTRNASRALRRLVRSSPNGPSIAMAIRAPGLPALAVNVALFSLAMKRLIRQLPGKMFVRNS
jgi:hypothetical protein